MWEAFQNEYLPDEPAIALLSHEIRSSSTTSSARSAPSCMVDGQRMHVHGAGNGPIDAFVTALNVALGTDIDVVDYAEHAMGAGKDGDGRRLRRVAHRRRRSALGRRHRREHRHGVAAGRGVLTAAPANLCLTQSIRGLVAA